ncbi:hypothetical protein LCGC14_0632120 [marine sediment metagenome]|uniref:Uncharacterized protein n=1 Tax=marine sediment metagenome TaxID=412755 RepID=A0A0F9RL14_9ZZZZ
MSINLEHVPEALRGKVHVDLLLRLDKDGFYCLNLDNDWDLHLYCMLLKQHGVKKDEARAKLEALPLIGVPVKKRLGYIEDILKSCVVGYESRETALPIYLQKDDGGKR